MIAVEIGEDDGGQGAAAVKLALAHVDLADDTVDGSVEHCVVEGDLGLAFAEFGLAYLGAGDLEVLLGRPPDEGVEGVLGDEQVAAGLADAELGLCDLGESGGDLGLVGAALRERELGLGDFEGDGHLLQLDGLGRGAGVGEALDLVVGALGLAHVDRGLADLGLLDGELFGGGAGEKLAVAGLGAGEGGFGAGDAGLGDGYVGLGRDDVGVGGRFFEFVELGAADLERDVSLFEGKGGVGDVELGEELTGLYRLAYGYEHLLDAAAGAK